MRQDPNDCVRVEDHHKSVLIKTWALKIWIFWSFCWSWRLNFTTDRQRWKSGFPNLRLDFSQSFIILFQWQPRGVCFNFLMNDCSWLSPVNNQFFMLTCWKLLGPKFPIKMTRENWPNRMLWTITTGNFRNTIFWAGRYRNREKNITCILLMFCSCTLGFKGMMSFLIRLSPIFNI